jgi:predicted kinase
LLYSKRLKPLLESHIEDILRAGTNVVLDFPANTRQQREWFLLLISNAEAPYEFYYLQTTDELCLKQIAQRRIEQPERALFDTEAVFHQVTRYFEEPDKSEGFEIRYA